MIALGGGIRRIDNKLRASADPYARAVAIWLNVPPTENDSEGLPETERERALATMASTSTDPRLYALAFFACHESSENSCHLLSARRWTELESTNAAPWIYLLDSAAAHGDVSGQQEAWFHIAASQRMDTHGYEPLLPIVDSAGGEDINLPAAETLSVIGIGISAAQRPSFGLLLKSCRGASLADANQLQLCSRVADLLFEHSDMFDSRRIGAAMSWRLNGDDRRNERINVEMEMLSHDPIVAPTQDGACEPVKRQVEYIRLMAKLGPLEALRQQAKLRASH